LIVDEVFADYRHDGHATPLLRSGGPLVFTLNGLSKLVGLPQLKLAWIHVAGNEPDKAMAKDLLEWMCDAHLSISSASQLAAPELLRRRAEFQGPILKRIATNLATLREFAATNQRLQPLWPQGGWCLPVRCVGIRDDEEFAIRLVKDEGVLIQPGYFFDFEDEETIVISLLPEPEVFREGLTRLIRALT
jgi:alanine-synthesizing transaminase